MGGTLEIVARAGRHLVHEDLFCDAPAKQHADLVEHVFAVVAVAVLRRKAHGHAQCAATRNDGHLVNRVALGQQLADQRVARLVVRGIDALALRHDHAFALGAHQNLVLRLLEVLHLDHARRPARRHQRRFIAKVRQIGTGHAGRPARDDVRADVLAQRHLAHVDVEDLLASTNIGQRHIDLAVETARAQQRRVQYVRPVGRGDHDHADVGFKSVHLNQHLVERLLAFIVTPTQAGSALASDRVDFVDKDDAGRILLGVIEHVANARSTDPDKHLYKVRTRNGKERHLGLAGDALGEQRLAGSRWAHQQQPARNAPAELLETLRVFQEVDNFLHLFLGLVASRYVGEGDLVGVLVEHARLAFPEAEGTALTAALHLAHEIDPHADQQQHRTPADKQRHQQRAFFARLDVELHAVGDQIADQTAVQIGCRGADLAVVVGDGDDFGSALPFLDDRALDAFGANLFQKIRIAQIARAGAATGVELLEHSEQHQGYYQPDRNFRKPLIIQTRLQSPGNTGHLSAILCVSSRRASI